MDELVRDAVEATLNGLLYAEDEEMCRAALRMRAGSDGHAGQTLHAQAVDQVLRIVLALS